MKAKHFNVCTLVFFVYCVDLSSTFIDWFCRCVLLVRGDCALSNMLKTITFCTVPQVKNGYFGTFCWLLFALFQLFYWEFYPFHNVKYMILIDEEYIEKLKNTCIHNQGVKDIFWTCHGPLDLSSNKMLHLHGPNISHFSRLLYVN